MVHGKLRIPIPGWRLILEMIKKIAARLRKMSVMMEEGGMVFLGQGEPTFNRFFSISDADFNRL
jgi:hypothetical protein